MNNNYKAVITEYGDKLLVFYLADNRAIEIQVFDNSDEYSVGDIYVGEVFNKKENIDSTFINITKGKTGYLKGTGHKNGSLLPVMVKKKTTADKQDIVTDKLSIPGIYNVVFETKTIRRTNADFVSEESVLNEKKYLQGIYDDIVSINNTRAKGTVLYKADNEVIKSVLSFRFNKLNEIVTDIEDVYSRFVSFYDLYKKNNIEILPKLKYYDDKQVSLTALYSLKTKLSEALSEKVYLRSGAYLYIEKTEALTVIDVNSGSTAFKGSKKETFHKVNLEAANEIARQLRLRNLSGIIIVDFINTNDEELDAELVNYVNEVLKDDNRKAKCHGMTNLSLCEITRNRVNAPIAELLKGMEI